MQKVLTAEQMREVDRLTTERYGIPSILLMENAAQAVAHVITEKLGGSVKDKSILILCGKGNNGGDGAAVARIFVADGAIVRVILFGKMGDVTGDARINLEKFSRIPDLHYEERDSSEAVFGQISGRFDVLVDAIFGTGLSRPLDAKYADLLNGIDAGLKVAVDLPSGIFADDTAVSPTQFHADATITFTAPKLANVMPPALRSCGQVIVAEIGTPQELIDEQSSQFFVAEQPDAADWLFRSRFSDDSYKNKRGHALVIAGSEDYSGAAVLAGNAAMRSGVGLVTLAVPASIRSETAARALPEVIVKSFNDFELDLKANAVLIGCGLDAYDPANEAMFRNVVEGRTAPVIVDAGALTYLQKPARKLGRNANVDNYALADTRASAPLILTPHEGEFLRLLGTSDKNEIMDRVTAVRSFATQNNVILVLKGERVLIGAPDGRVIVNPTGNSGLGKAGNGDTLAGILVGFVAQAVKMDIDIFDTVVAAAYIAGMAGDVAEKKYGKRVMTASDVRESLVEVFEQLENN